MYPYAQKSWNETFAMTVGLLAGMAANIYSLWLIYVCFRGGSIPLLDIETSGGFGLGFLAIAIGTPIINIIAQLVGAGVAVAFCPIISRLDA